MDSWLQQFGWPACVWRTYNQLTLLNWPLINLSFHLWCRLSYILIKSTAETKRSRSQSTYITCCTCANEIYHKTKTKLKEVLRNWCIFFFFFKKIRRFFFYCNNVIVGKKILRILHHFISNIIDNFEGWSDFLQFYPVSLNMIEIETEITPAGVFCFGSHIFVRWQVTFLT